MLNDAYLALVDWQQSDEGKELAEHDELTNDTDMEVLTACLRQVADAAHTVEDMYYEIEQRK